jgi:DNA-binding MarR family transcriptional regulator
MTMLASHTSQTRPSPADWLAAYRERDARFGPIKEGPWRILLDIAAKGPCSVTSAALASGRPGTTGLRYIADLELRGLIERIAHPDDRRSDMLHLTTLARERLCLNG